MTVKEYKKLPKGTKVYFKGMEFYHRGCANLKAFGTPLCTKEQYENMKLPFAHVFIDGITRFGKPIGTIADLSLRNPELEVKHYN